MSISLAWDRTRIINHIDDFRQAARQRLPRFLFDYLDGGAGGEDTMLRNIEDLRHVHLRQRVMTDVSSVNTRIQIFGQELRLPIVLGPVGIAGMYRRRGEVQAASAAAAHGIPFCLSTVGLCGIEEVACTGADQLWFQLYVLRDRAFMRDLLAKAAEAGCRTLVFTVDMPVPGRRLRDARSGMTGRYAPARRMMQALIKPRWAWDVGVRGRPHSLGNLDPVLGTKSGLEDYMGWLGANFDPSISWKDLEWIRSAWTGSLVIKGVLDPEDARAAAALGANGLVVSNHGGRQLDGAPSTARSLPSIADAVGDDVTVLADGGVRSGTDLLRMLGLGAKAVMLGRPWVYALASDGRNGVSQMLYQMEDDLRVALALTGVAEIADFGAKNIVHGAEPWAPSRFSCELAVNGNRRSDWQHQSSS